MASVTNFIRNTPLASLRDYFTAAGIETPRLDAEVIAEHPRHLLMVQIPALARQRQHPLRVELVHRLARVHVVPLVPALVGLHHDQRLEGLAIHAVLEREEVVRLGDAE